MWWAGPLWWDMQCITGLFLSRSVLHVIWSGWSPYQFLVEGNMSWKPPRMELDFLNNTLLLMWRLFVSNLSITFFICRIFCMYDSWVSWEHLVLSDQYVFAFSCFSKTLLLPSSGKKLYLLSRKFCLKQTFWKFSINRLNNMAIAFSGVTQILLPARVWYVVNRKHVVFLNRSGQARPWCPCEDVIMQPIETKLLTLNSSTMQHQRS